MSQQTKDQLRDQLTGHLYDGIEEYDNPTPGWWKWLFIGTILFGILYWFVFTMSFGQLSAPAFLEMAKSEETMRQFGSLGAINPDAQTILKFAHDEKWLAVGKNIFLSKCAACHARDGSGINGANLTDDKYINVNKVEDIVDVVASGRANGAMPAWRNQMNENEIIMVSAFVASLRGQNLAGRAPEANAKEISAWHE